MRYTGLSLSQTPPRTSSIFLHQPHLVTTTRQGGPESQPQSQPLVLQSLSPRCLSRLSSPHFYSSCDSAERGPACTGGGQESP